MNQILPAKNEVTWLVKSGDRILGPYSAETVESLLKSREIVVIDEIKRASTRWKYIRDEAFFAVAVEQLRKSHQSKADDTEHGTLSNTTATLTSTIDISRTLDLDQPDRDVSQSAYIKDAEFVDINTSNEQKYTPPVATKQFGVTTNLEQQKNLKKSSSTAWTLALIFVGVALTIAYKIQIKQAPLPQGPDFAKTYDRAVKNYRQGYFADSLRYYKEAATLRPADPDVIIGMAPLLLNIESQKVEVKRKIGEVLAIVHSEDQVKQAKNILGLVAIADEDFVEADRQFNDALKIDPKYLPSLFNTAIVHFIQKDFSESITNLTKVLIEDPDNAPAAYLMIRAKVSQNLATRKPSFHDLHDEINKFTRRFYDLKQETLLIDAYLYSREEMKQQIHDQIIATLESDPFVTDEFLRDPLMSTSQLGWIHLANYCDEMFRKLSNSSDMKALYAVCLMKTGRAQEGPKLIEEALAQSPNDSLLLSIKAYTLMASGRSEEAHGALELAKKNQPNNLSKILLGRICMKTKDNKCIRENFQDLGTQEFTPAISAVGLAEVAHREGSSNSAKIYRDQLRQNLRNYLPSIRLESEFGEN